MRRFLTILLIFTLMLSFISCGGKKEEEETDPSLNEKGEAAWNYNLLQLYLDEKNF